MRFMLEWLMVPALIGVAALIPGTQSDKKKIQTIFNTIGYGVPSKDKKSLLIPRFKKRISILDGEEQIGIRYIYSIPLGLPASQLAEKEKQGRIFTDGLNRPVIVEFKASIEKDPRKYLTISVFNKDIPNLYPYKNVPSIADKWVIPLGRTLEETIWHDFDKVPHMTVSGTTRFGKTVFLKVLVTYLIEHHPDDVELYIIDLKGGLEFGRYETLQQVKGVASNPVEACRILQTIHAQLQGDYKMFRKNFWNNIANTPITKRRFIIVDEAAQLAPEKWMEKDEKDLLGACQWILGEITRIGGGLGYREVFCTQYPTADTLPRSIKQNSDGKITFRLPSGYASEVAIDEKGAEKLPSDVKGRGLYKTHELKEMQVPLIEDSEMWARLAQYQKGDITSGSNKRRKKKEEGGTDLVEFIDAEIRHEGSAAETSQPRSRKKRSKGSKSNERVSSHPEPRGEERLLPKPKRKGVSRNVNRSEMEHPGGTPPVAE
jgi:DNA segregation ATPase FtsK/SpoIIIE, S-DNA-T family